MHNYINMQQDNYSSESVRFTSDGTQNPQYIISSEGQANSSMPGMQQNPRNVLHSGSTLTTSQPPPYPVSQPLPSMTHAFSQQRQPQYSGNVVSPRVPYHHSPQPSYQGQSTYSTGAQGQAYVGGPVVSPSSISALSPSGRLSMPQGIQSLSPGAPTMPRKSLAGMMSPIRAQQSLNMPPPSSPVLRGQGPVSPLSIYMSQAQSPRRIPVGQVQSMPGRGYPPPRSPVYQQPMSYLYGPQQPQITPSSPVAGPRYLDTSQHGQLSPLVQAQGHLHSPQSIPSAALTMQVQRSPFKAARQLNMATSPTKVQPYSGAAMPQQWQYASRSTSQEMWESAPIAPVIPSLPILSSDTLDLLSTLTVSTVTSPVQSSAVPGVAGSRMPKSPLLQQHLLMPAQPIRTPSTEGNLLVVSGTGMPFAMSTTAAPSIARLRSTTEAPPSRSNQKHSVRPTLIANEENLINLSDTAITTCTIATSTLSTSSIVTSMCTDKTVGPEKRGENMNTPSSASGLAAASEAGSSRNSSMAPTLNFSPMDVVSSVKSVVSSQSVCNTALSVSESFMDTSRPQSSEICPVPPEIIENRKKLCEFHKAKLQEKLVLYKECLTELFFLQNGGNFMDYGQFKKRPSTKLLDYLKKMIPENKQGCRKLRKISQDSITSNGEAMSPVSDTSNTSSKKNSTEDAKKARFLSESQGTSVEKMRSQTQDLPAIFSQVGGTKGLISPSSQINHVPVSKGQSSPLRLKRLSRQGPTASLDESMRSQEEILERAKQEAVIQRKVVELRKRGLWTQRRLPKVQEPPRNKTHWDYLLEEMRWLSADFAQERKWKRAAARKLVRAVSGYHKEQHDHVRRLKREEQNRLRRIASTMAREIRIFWGNIGKVVEYKQRSLLDEKRQKALDLHLSYIVDQTEKYSDWLTQGLNKQQPSGGSSPSRSLASSKQGSDDDDFLPQGASSDDEETIAVAEQELEKQENTEDELSLLKQESELPFDELLNSLPPELIENIGKPLEGPKMEEVMEASEKDEKPVMTGEAAEATTSEKDPEVSTDEDAEPFKPTPISLRRSARKRKADSTDFHRSEDSEVTKKLRVKSEGTEGDEEFKAEDEEAAGGGDEDDEATMEEEEKKEEVDHEKEIADLQVEGEMPIEELMKMYGASFNQDPDQEEETAEEDESQDDEPEAEAEEAMKEESSSESEEEESEKEEEEEIGMDYLFNADLTKDVNAPMIIPTDESESKEEMLEEKGSPSKEITDVAAEAASLQPTGFTLATTQVVTPIPILLKHTLREYQHIGLDWLVTMYDKRLNGILADEMGLGKTMQTIALLAHLACDKGVWGPHLIVVPTSVMLNWEMEFKKWCPGFKILTYYGSQKERKAKRTGWTKSNAFHVCITSYKLVLQDNTSFRRKKWKYLVLDEAQNIKNFKSQRWQTLLNFNSQRRLLLTGTPLQNNLMELWSLMHFLMPHVFQSHKEFKEWFSNPLTGMIEGSHEYNEKLVRRLHKVLRPFLLRRMKKDVEKQMPNKYEHVVRCHLSKRQRFLYDDFMSQGSTRDTLECGHFMSVINILMQLRKVCNHPNLFEPRPIVSPFMNDRVDFHASSLVTKVLDKGPFQTLNLQDYHLHLPSLTSIGQYNAGRVRQLKTPRKLIEELDVDRQPLEEERHSLPRMQAIREHLGSLVKERERQKVKNVTALNLSQQSLHLLQHGQQTGTLPVLTIPITSSMQLSTSSGTTRVITLPQSRPDDSSGRAVTSQSFTLQYQTPQGTRVSIPGKQVIRQIPGRVLQIMTTGAGSKAQTISQPVISLSQVSQGSLPRQNGGVSMEPRVSVAEVNKAGKKELETLEIKDPSSYLERLEREFLREHRLKCSRMANMNDKRCEASPEWLPGDTIDLLKNIYKRPEERKYFDRNSIESTVMPELVKSGDLVLKEIMPVTDRFVFVIPTVEAKPVDFHVSHPSPSQKNSEEFRAKVLESALKREVGPLHSIDLKMRIQFPEARLIQYDCGKLQVLNILLRRLWGEKHKCLIFTQMTKVLDVLEVFLSYHGYRYLRLDGSTKVEQRMLLMERFNNDPRIFCFILSTRSGGIGVNLTGADTVIFYDSDWNPTMDAQAQDRCHRIGQTRDVHIYRLISERTVEENILKKANQKRLLGDLAIEGGSFTTAFFKEQAIKDLFNEPSGLEDLSSVEMEQPASAAAVSSKPITARQKAIAAAKEAEGKAVAAGSTSESKQPKASSWEDALQQTEDKEDVDAAIQLREEQDADMEEFTENAEGEEATEVSKVHEEMKSIYEELAPIEKYALRYLEETTEEMNREELEMAEEQVYRSKQDWEIAHLVARKEEEERRLEEEEDEIFYTREDAENQIYIDDVTGETMPVWFPPTPPQDDNDIYIDPIARLLYLPGRMPEDQLPAIHIRRERKRTKTEPDGPGGVPSQKRKLSRAEFLAPRSLFNRPQSQFKKRELKQPKYRPQLKKVHSVLPQAKAVALPTLPTLSSASADKENVTATAEQQGLSAGSTSAVSSTDTLPVSSNKNLDWLINEDWKLLQAVQQILEMPLTLAVLLPAHTANWDLVADIVNSISSVYRSPKMCKQRFENVIAPREEGRTAPELQRDIKKKIKGTKTPTKVKITKPQKTISMHSMDNNTQQSVLYSNRFSAIKETCSKRTMPLKTSSLTQFQRNPKHTSMLMENGINYDKPLPPVQIASLRADRIAREKALEVAKQQQQLVQSQAIQAHTSNMQQICSGQGSKPGLTSLSQLTAIPLSGSASNIIVNPSALSAITKKINQHTASKTLQGNATLQQTLLRTVVSASDQSQQMQQHQSQIQIQQPGQAGTMVTVGRLLHRLSSPGATTSITTAVASNNTIPLSSLSRPSITIPTGAVIQQGSQQLTKQHQMRLQQQLQLQKQQRKPVKAQLTPRKLQITPEAMKKLTQQRQQQQHLEANIVTVPGKQRKTTITQQELEQLLLKNPTMRRQMPKVQTTQVQIAPVHAQVQAQQVQEAAAQQAAQHVMTSKPLPITVPVSNLVSVAAVNLGGMNMSISSTSAQGKSLVMTGQQVPAIIQQQLHRQLMKQRLVTQQQQQQQAQLQTQQQGQMQSKVGVKQTVYAMVAAPHMTQGKRRVNVAASTSGQQLQSSVQQPVQLTVTKLLQSQSIPGQPTTQLKQSMTQQSAEAMTQQIRQQSVAQQQLQVASATIVPPSNVMMQQRLLTSQRRIRQIQHMASNPQSSQKILTSASLQQFIHRPNQNVVASISIGAPGTAVSAQHQMTLSTPIQQNANLSQQLQSLLTPQVLRAHSQSGVTVQAAMRPTVQQHHLVLSQVTPQQTLAISPQNPTMAMTSTMTPTTMTLAPSLIQLPVSVIPSVVGSQSQPQMAQPPISDTSSGLQQQPTSASMQYVTRTMPPQ